MFTNILDITNLQLWEKKLDLSSSFDLTKTDFEIEPVDQKTCREMAAQNNWQANFTTTIDEILDYSDICFIAKADGKMVHWTHITFKSAYIAEINKRIQPNSDSAYLYGIFTAKDFRKKGIASAVIEKVADYLTEKGIKKLQVIVDSHNNSMAKIVNKTGFEQIGAVKLVKIGKLKLYRYKGRTKEFLTSK
jgi:RimJ/RimL family protein N-acetyltransferase